jgi:hypothetical protein
MKYLLSKKSELSQILSKSFFGIAIVVYLAINLFIYQDFWQELNFDGSSVNAVYGEIMAIEWYLEGVYQNIIQGRNPFSSTQNLFYPFGTNFVSSESGNAFYFIFTRPFFSTHQSLYLISALSIVAANLGMYLLMRLLKTNKLIAFFIGLFFGYMTFLQPRMGHITYLSIYIFPWFYFSVLSLINTKVVWKKITYSFLTAFFLVMALYHNLYYFVMLALSIGIVLIYGLIIKRKLVVNILKRNYQYLMIFLLTSLVMLSPWLVAFRQTQMFESLPKASGWSGAIEYSSDLFGYFIPSAYSLHLGGYAEKINYELEFNRGAFENFSYVGIIIIGCALVYFYWLITKKELGFRKKYSGLTIVTISFWLLTLGPFLHVAGRWCAKPLRGVCIAIPMPFVLFHYLPFMGNIRSPGRLVAGLIFFAYILSGLIINKIHKKSSKLFQYLIIAGLAAVFVIDHQFIYSPALPNKLPDQIYETIRQDKEFFSVYQIPSIMRDGFVYFGDLSSLDFFISQPRFNKPTLAGYAGRFPGYKTSYYMNDPFLGYFGRLMDKNLDKNPRIDPNDTTDWTKIDLIEAKKSIDFLDIKYVIIDDRKSYLEKATKSLIDLGFLKQMTEGDFSLWLLGKPLDNEYLEVNFDDLGSSRHLAMGWDNGGDGEIRFIDNQTSVLFKTQTEGEYTLFIDGASSDQDKTVQVYLNQSKVGKINFFPEISTLSLTINQPLIEGINTIHLIFPSDNDPYTAKIKKIYLEKRN